jgi:hypothetical protein
MYVESSMLLCTVVRSGMLRGYAAGLAPSFLAAAAAAVAGERRRFCC